MRNSIVSILFFLSVVAYATTDNLLDWKNSKSDTFDIEIAENFRAANYTKRNEKGRIYISKNALLFGFDSISKIKFEDIKRVRIGYFNYPFIKIVLRSKSKSSFLISFRHRSEYEIFIRTMK
ncbi:MAG: hypothetical protein ACKVOU_08115, partial [Cytophagales bacterium]